MLGYRLHLSTILITVALSVYAMPAASGVANEIDQFFKQLVDGQGSVILSPDQAFIASAKLTSNNRINVHWEIAKGYYLYHDKFDFSLVKSNNNITEVTMEPGIYKNDPDFGNVLVHYYNSDAQLTLASDVQAMPVSELLVTYQGCKENVLCYPPTSNRLHITPLTNKTVNDTATQSNRSQSQAPVQDMISTNLLDGNLWHKILTFFGFGLLLSLTPCVFPMVPILSGIIVGQGQRIKPLNAFFMSLAYVLGMAVTYAVLGIIAGLFSINLQTTAQNIWIITAFSGIFVLLALSMFGFYELKLPTSWYNKLTQTSNTQNNSLKGVAIMGVLSAIIVGPCVAPPLAAALLYISQTGDAVLGGTVLFSMGLGMGMTLLVIGTSIGKLLPKAGKWMISIKYIFGVLMLATAIWFMERVLPPSLVLILWALLLMISSVYMGAIDRVATTSQWQKLWRGLGLAMLTYGIILMVGAAMGNGQVFKPWAGLSNKSQNYNTNASTLAFQPIKGIDELQTALDQARHNNKTVMLDFYADWCITCKEMEHGAFAEPAVHQLLENTVLLQADVTKNDALDKTLLKKFGLYGPPAILFFNEVGVEQASQRIIGFVNSEDFLKHIQHAFSL